MNKAGFASVSGPLLMVHAPHEVVASVQDRELSTILVLTVQ